MHSTSDTVSAVLMLSSGLLITVTVCCFCCKLTKRRNERRMDPDAAERRDARRRTNKQVQRHAAARGRSEQPQQQGAGDPSRPRRPLSASNWMSPVPGEERSRSSSGEKERQRETATETERDRSRREQQQQVQQEQQPAQPQPSDIEVMEYASGVLGIDPIADAELLYLSREGLVAPLPPAWRAIEDSEAGEIYFYHERTGRVTWEHPADKHHRKLAKAALAAKYGSSPRSVDRESSSSEGTDSDSELERIEIGPLTPAPKPRPSLPRGTMPAPPPRPRAGAVTPNRAPVPFRRPGAVHVIGATGFLAREAGMALSPRDFRYSGGGEVAGRRSASPLDAGEPWLSPRHRQRSASARYPAGAQAAGPDTEDNEVVLLPDSLGAADKSSKLEEV